MANAFQIEIQGARALEAKLRGLSKVLADEIKNELQAAAFTMNGAMVRNITSLKLVDQGFLRGSQSVFWSAAEKGYVVANTAYYAPFLEFGTKKQVSVPAEWADYALQFKGFKQGTIADFEKNIEQWLKRKGFAGDETQRKSAAFFIVRHILINGLKPRPFAYPAYQDTVKLLPDRINKVIENILR